MQTRTRLALLGGVVVLVASVVAAVTVVASSQPLTEGSQPQACTGPSRLTCPPSLRDTLVVATSLPETLDAEFSGGFESSEAYLNLYDPLLFYRVVNKPGFQQADIGKGLASYVPWLAKSVTVSPDKRTWRLTLRRGVMSHSGNELTTADIKYIFDRHAALKATGAFLDSISAANNKSLRIIDKYTFEFTTPKPNALTAVALATHMYMPLDSTEVKKHATKADPWSTKWLARNEAGFGPYRLVTWQPGNQFVMERFDGYWGPKPSIRRIIYKDVPETANRLALLKAGQVDIAKYLAPAELQNASRTSTLKVASAPGTQMVFGTLNVRKGPLANPVVRQALQTLTDQQQIVKIVFFNKYARVWNDVIPDYMAGWTGRHWPWTFNLAKGKKLLAKAGYPNGGFTVEILTNTSEPTVQKVAIVLRDQWRHAGVNVIIDRVPPTAFNVRRTNGKFGLVLSVGDIFIPDTGYLFSLFYKSGSFLNWSGFAEPRIDADIAESLTTLNAAKRVAAFRRAAAILRQELPWLSLPLVNTTIAMKRDVQGYTSYPWASMQFANFYIGSK